MRAGAPAATDRPEPGFVELHGGDASVVVLPALGGKIRDITLAGRQWLWHNPAVPFTVTDAGATCAPMSTAGGFDECIPSMTECLIPTWVQGVRSRQIPQHGELWSQQPRVSVTADTRGPAVTCVWQGAALPYRFSRTVEVRHDGSLLFEYALTNSGAHRMPFLWTSYPVLPLTRHTRIVLPEGARTRVGTQHGIVIGRPGAEHRWPRLRVGSGLVDMSQPAASHAEGFACKLFVDLPKGEVVIALEEKSVRLEMRVNGDSVPRVGLWIDRRAPAPVAAKRWGRALLTTKAVTSQTVVLGPCLGAPDNLSEALGAWDDACWVDAGATTRWAMQWQGLRVQPAAGT